MIFLLLAPTKEILAPSRLRIAGIFGLLSRDSLTSQSSLCKLLAKLRKVKMDQSCGTDECMASVWQQWVFSSALLGI